MYNRKVIIFFTLGGEEIRERGGNKVAVFESWIGEDYFFAVPTTLQWRTTMDLINFIIHVGSRSSPLCIN